MCAHLTSFRAVISLLGLVGVVAPAHAQTWSAEIVNQPDFYQHQRWGSDGDADKDWEDGGGWCYFAATLGQMYCFRVAGLRPFSDNAANTDILDDTKWLNTSNAELRKLVADVKKATLTPADPLLSDWLNVVLNDRGVGPKAGAKKGIVRFLLYQDGADVKYKSSEKDGTGAHKIKKFAGTTLFEYGQTVLKDRNTATLILTDPAVDRTKRWWAASFHAVIMQGYDKAANPKKLWFSDPDSNPTPGGANPDEGNRNSDGGWTFKKPDDEAAIRDACKARRFRSGGGTGGGDGLPVAAAAPGAADITRRFVPATLAADQKSFSIAAGDHDRYDGVAISQLMVMEINKAGRNDPPAPLTQSPMPLAAASGPKQFQISPGRVGAMPIDECWVFPADTSVTFVTNLTDGMDNPLTGWEAQIIPPGPTTMDPWGNLRPNGYLRFSSSIDPNSAAYGPPLTDESVLEFTYETTNTLPIQAWDLVVNDRTDPEGMRIQVYGGGYDLSYIQSPGCDSLQGDLNDDNRVDGEDVVLFAQCLVNPVAYCACGDFDVNGRVDGADHSAFIDAVLAP